MVAPIPLVIGDRYKSNKSGYFTIMEYLGTGYYRVMFEDGYETTALRHSIVTGHIKNPNHPTIFGVGFISQGEYNSNSLKRGTSSTIYKMWYHMFQRCYDPKVHEKYPRYKDVTVHSDWYNFQVFAHWVENNPYNKAGWDLDKDLLQLGVENKVYGPETCCFLPRLINGSIIRTPLELDQFHKQVIIYKVGEKYHVKNKDRQLSDSFDCIEDAVNLLISHRKMDFYKFSIKYKDCLDPRAVQVLQDYPIRVDIVKLKKYLDINYLLSAKLMDTLNDLDPSRLSDLLTALDLQDMA